MANLVVFLLDGVLRLPPMRAMHLHHMAWAWWQPLTACFCHASRSHLSGNVFLLLLFGRSVEDDLGWGGLLFSFAFCGILANLASLALLPAATVSVGVAKDCLIWQLPDIYGNLPPNMAGERRRVGRGLRPLLRLRALAAHPARL